MSGGRFLEDGGEVDLLVRENDGAGEGLLQGDLVERDGERLGGGVDLGQREVGEAEQRLGERAVDGGEVGEPGITGPVQIRSAVGGERDAELAFGAGGTGGDEDVEEGREVRIERAQREVVGLDLEIRGEGLRAEFPGYGEVAAFVPTQFRGERDLAVELGAGAGEGEGDLVDRQRHWARGGSIGEVERGVGDFKRAEGGGPSGVRRRGFEFRVLGFGSDGRGFGRDQLDEIDGAIGAARGGHYGTAHDYAGDRGGAQRGVGSEVLHADFGNGEEGRGGAGGDEFEVGERGGGVAQPGDGLVGQGDFVVGGEAELPGGEIEADEVAVEGGVLGERDPGDLDVSGGAEWLEGERAVPGEAFAGLGGGGESVGTGAIRARGEVEQLEGGRSESGGERRAARLVGVGELAALDLEVGDGDGGRTKRFGFRVLRSGFRV